MTVYYLCSDATHPSAGFRTAYDHVDSLNRHGIDAAVAHEYSGFRASWFANDTRVVGWSRRRPRRPAGLHEWKRGRMYARDATRRYVQLNQPPDFDLHADDVLVVPAIYGPRLGEIAPGIRKVILNQGATSMPLRTLDLPLRHPDIMAVLVVAEEALDFFEWLTPHLRVGLVPYAVDLSVFHLRTAKERQIAYMPRRNGEHAEVAVRLLAERGTLRGFDLVSVDGQPHVKVAEIVGSSLLFLAVSLSEGFGVPPAEAMGTGSVVVGYDAVGGREYMKPDVCFTVPTGDVLALARELERVIAMADAEPERLAARGRAAHELIADRYSPARQERELLAFWRAVLHDA